MKPEILVNMDNARKEKQEEKIIQDIYVRVKLVYGNKTIYPICQKAKLICSLLNTKTIPQNKIYTIKKLGYNFIIEQHTL